MQVHNGVCSHLQQLARNYGHHTSISVRITRINEGKSGLKPVEKVPFFFYDRAKQRIASRQWTVREFRREHASNHNEAHCSEKFFCHFMYEKRQENADFEEQLEVEGKRLFDEWLKGALADAAQQAQAGKRMRNAAPVVAGGARCGKAARRDEKSSESSVQATTEALQPAVGVCVGAAAGAPAQGAHDNPIADTDDSADELQDD